MDLNSISKFNIEMQKSNTSFVRWQARTIDELGKVINLLLSLCLASVGFVVSKLLDKGFVFQSYSSKNLILIGISIILLSMGLLLILIHNRLSSLRQTAQIARKRETGKTVDIETLRLSVMKIDKRTWYLFQLSIWTFSIGQLLIIIGFMVEMAKRL